ncbi:MAG: hypothetical protein FK730_13665, partial [Asgard group archaeon]|nr:hypothetical protein [Asgard group archaeon]
MLKKKINDSIRKLDEWISINGWSGWDPFDLQCSFFLHRLAKRNKFFRYIHSLVFKLINKKTPTFSRKFLRIKKQINPKAMGLFVSAYCSLYTQTNEISYLKKAEEAANWLLKNNNKQYKDLC